MIKAIIFDFDGVIIESAGIKTEAFRKLFAGYPGHLDEIVGYHLKYQGISRYVKFRRIYKEILKKDITKKDEETLGKRFSEIVLREILSAPFVAGARDFLEANSKKFHLFVASGTPEEELMGIISARGLKKYFEAIHGSPDDKTDIIRSIGSKHGFLENEMVYIGDADSDRIAAGRAGILFIERNPEGAPRGQSRYGHPVIRDLTELESVLRKIEETRYKRSD